MTRIHTKQAALHRAGELLDSAMTGDAISAGRELIELARALPDECQCSACSDDERVMTYECEQARNVLEEARREAYDRASMLVQIAREWRELGMARARANGGTL